MSAARTLARLTKLCLAPAGGDLRAQGATRPSGCARRSSPTSSTTTTATGSPRCAGRRSSARTRSSPRPRPERFYVPAYIGPRGWAAVRLDRGAVDWDEVDELVSASYCAVAPRALVARLQARVTAVSPVRRASPRAAGSSSPRTTPRSRRLFLAARALVLEAAPERHGGRVRRVQRGRGGVLVLGPPEGGVLSRRGVPRAREPGLQPRRIAGRPGGPAAGSGARIRHVKVAASGRPRAARRARAGRRRPPPRAARW